MKAPKYPRTPMRNCLYCKHYNPYANACSAPGVDKIAIFNPNPDIDCILFKYDKSETPKTNNKDFVAKYCIGTKCPYYYQKLDLCTRPSLCPYKDEEQTTFEKLKFDNEI